MSSDDPDYGRCTATSKTTGERCRRDAIGEHGKCRYHGGATPTKAENPNVGAPPGNGNAISHGCTAAPITLLNHLEPEELEWIEALVDAYLQRAPFGPDDARVERLTRVCVMIYQEWKSEEVILDEGLSSDVVVDVTSSGEPIVRTEEHYLSRRAERLNDKVRHNLRDLGLLETEDAVGRQPKPGTMISSEHLTITFLGDDESNDEND